MTQLPWLIILHTVHFIRLGVPVCIHNSTTTVSTEKIQDIGSRSYSKYPFFMKMTTVYNEETPVGRSTY
jgi:hypothetical protein